MMVPMPLIVSAIRNYPLFLPVIATYPTIQPRVSFTDFGDSVA